MPISRPAKPLRDILGQEAWAKLRNKAFNKEQAGQSGMVVISQEDLRKIFDHFEPRRADCEAVDGRYSYSRCQCCNGAGQTEAEDCAACGGTGLEKELREEFQGKGGHNAA